MLASEEAFLFSFPRKLFLCGVLCLFSAALSAAPKLRLSTAALGPILIPTGQSGSAQAVDAGNIGDGSLALTASSSVTWITASIGAARGCTIAASCQPVNIALNTASLARGSYTGIVMVNDPNAVDAPQNISVTVQIGSAVPDSLDLYVPPGKTATAGFVAGSLLSTSVTNPTGGPTLLVALSGGGSFGFTVSYQVTATAPASTAENDYKGSFTVSGSAQATDNKAVPVTIHVTSQPIAVPSPASVSFRIAQGAAKAAKWVVFANSGLGNLTLASATGNQPWLTTTVQGTTAVITAEPAGMSPGTYQGSVAVVTNAKNGSATIPVQLQVLAAGPPTVFFKGVVDNALFKAGDPVAPGGIVAVTGEQFSTGAAVSAQALPLPPSLGGASVFVNGIPAPMFYTAASHVVNDGGQINFQIPYSTAAGAATVRVDRDGQRGNSVSVQIAARVPRLLRLGIGDYPIATLSDYATFPIPTTPGLLSRPVKAGEYLIFYALGLGQTNPPVTEGQPAPGAEPLARVDATVVFGAGVRVPPYYSGLAGNFAGLYQIVVQVPTGLTPGSAVPVFLDLGGNVFSNVVNIAVAAP